MLLSLSLSIYVNKWFIYEFKEEFRLYKVRVDFRPHASRLHEAGVLTLKKVTSKNTRLFTSHRITDQQLGQIKIMDV